MQVRIEIPKAQVNAAIKGLRDIRNGAPMAVTRAINRSLPTLRTAINRELRKEYNLKAGLVNKAMSIVKAAPRAQRYWGEVRIADKPIKLIHYGARQTKKGVTVRIMKSRGRKLYRRAWINRGGFASVKTRTAYRRGKTGRWSRSGTQVWDESIEVVFQRKGKSRLPIDTPFGPSVRAGVEHRVDMAKIERIGQEAVERNLLSRMDELFKRNGYPPRHRSVA